MNPQRDESAFCNPPLGELQKKAHIYMIAVASSPVSSGFTLEDVVQSYAIYDWTTPSTGDMRREGRERRRERTRERRRERGIERGRERRREKGKGGNTRREDRKKERRERSV